MSRTPNPKSKDSQQTPPNAAPVIRLRRAVATSIGSGALGAVSLEVPAGGSHVLTGEAGSGKSSVLRMIALAQTPRSGVLELFGEDVASVGLGKRHALRRRIGMIFQDPRLIDSLSAYDNVALAARAVGRQVGDYARQVDEVLSWVGLGRQAEDLAGGLADEARRRLQVARAVINRPDLMIADEPAAHGGQAVLRLLADLHEAGTTVLLATRDGTLAASAGPDATHLSRTSASWPAGGARELAP
jgi:cell division transport system ATP-binding protein